MLKSPNRKIPVSQLLEHLSEMERKVILPRARGALVGLSISAFIGNLIFGLSLAVTFATGGELRLAESAGLAFAMLVAATNLILVMCFMHSERTRVRDLVCLSQYGREHDLTPQDIE
jgi:hypothetical protein